MRPYNAIDLTTVCETFCRRFLSNSNFHSNRSAIQRTADFPTARGTLYAGGDTAIQRRRNVSLLTNPHSKLLIILEGWGTFQETFYYVILLTTHTHYLNLLTARTGRPMGPSLRWWVLLLKVAGL